MTDLLFTFGCLAPPGFQGVHVCFHFQLRLGQVVFQNWPRWAKAELGRDRDGSGRGGPCSTLWVEMDPG